MEFFGCSNSTEEPNVSIQGSISNLCCHYRGPAAVRDGASAGCRSWGADAGGAPLPGQKSPASHAPAPPPGGGAQLSISGPRYDPTDAAGMPGRTFSPAAGPRQRVNRISALG